MSVADNPARIRDIADAIALELNATLAVINESDGSAISPPRFTAARSYGKDYANTDLATLRVDVRPPAAGMDVESRGGGQDAYQIEIAVQQMAATQAAIDLLMDLTYHAGRAFAPEYVLGANGGPYGNVELNTVQVIESVIQLYAPDKIQQGRYFGMVTLTLREFVTVPRT